MWYILHTNIGNYPLGNKVQVLNSHSWKFKIQTLEPQIQTPWYNSWRYGFKIVELNIEFIQV